MSDLFTPLAPFGQALSYHLARQAVLAGNVANAETPGYRPFDLAFSASLDRASRPARTNPRHMGAGGSDATGPETALFRPAAATPGPNGNAVDVDREMAKLAANSVRYRAVIEMLNRRLATLRYAIHEGPR